MCENPQPRAAFADALVPGVSVGNPNQQPGPRATAINNFDKCLDNAGINPEMEPQQQDC